MTIQSEITVYHVFPLSELRVSLVRVVKACSPVIVIVRLGNQFGKYSFYYRCFNEKLVSNTLKFLILVIIKIKFNLLNGSLF